MSGQGNKEVPEVTGAEVPVGTMKMKGPVTSARAEQAVAKRSPSNGAAGSTHLIQKSIARVQAHFSSPHSSRRVRRFSVLCPLPKQVSLLAGYKILKILRLDCL